MKNKRIQNSMLVVDANGMVRKSTEVLAVENAITLEKALSLKAHNAFSRKLTKNIHNVVPVIEGVIVRAGKNQDGEIYIYGQKFFTEGNNCPNARALMEYAGDFNATEKFDVQLSTWNEKERKLEDSYSVTCNDKNAKRLYVFTKTQVLVVYGELEKDLKNIYGPEADEQMIAKKKQEYVDNIEAMGLKIGPKGGISLAGKVAPSTEGSHLTVLYWSPSNMRNETQLFTPVKQNEAFKILDQVSGGALSLALKGELTISGLIKLSARLGIMSAPAISIGVSADEETGYVIVLDKIKGPQDYDKAQNANLLANGIEIDDNTSDGAVCVSVQEVQKAFKMNGTNMTIEKALYFAMQTRADKVFTKVFGEAKTQENMQFRLKRLIEMYGADRVLYLKAGEDVTGLDKYKELLKANKIANDKLPENERLSEKEIANKTLKDLKEFYKVIVVGNKDNLGYIIDKNGGKLLDNIDLQKIAEGNITTYLLDVAKCSDTATSGQMLSKFLVADKLRAIKALLGCVIRQFDNELNEMLYGDIDTENCSLAQFMLRHGKTEDNENAGQFNAAALESLVKEFLPRFESAINKSKIDIRAYFQRALFDDSFFLTNKKINGILETNEHTGRLECYSRDVEVKFADEIAEIEADESLSQLEKDAKISWLLTAAVIKYPSVSSNEFALVTYVTSKQLKRRIGLLYKAGIITEEEKDVLEDDFLNTSYGVTKLGADNTLKHKLAGMDTDYDGVAVVFEQELVQILVDKNKDNDGVVTVISK